MRLITRLNCNEIVAARLIAPWSAQRSPSTYSENATIRWFCSPSPSTDKRTRSPGFKKRGGLKPMPTPDGVPVGITSPGSKVVKWLT